MSIPALPAADGVLTKPADTAYTVMKFALGLVVVGVLAAAAVFNKLERINERITAVQVDVATIKGQLAAEKHAQNP